MNSPTSVGGGLLQRQAGPYPGIACEAAHVAPQSWEDHLKLKPITEAVLLWLPGFEPASPQTAEQETPAPAAEQETPAPAAVPEVPAEVVTQKRDTIGYVRRPVAPAPPKAVWPYLTAEAMGQSGDAAKADANLAAIRVLKELDGAPLDADDTERRAILNRYTGWGGLPKLFGGYLPEETWQARAKSLRELLSDEDYESARASTPNAHYTSHEVISAMWAMAERLGFKGGRVLEPAAGVGYFLGAMPTHLAQRSEIRAVELDTTSAAITKALYAPFGVKVRCGGFERFTSRAGHYDLVISNVPFGNYQVNDESGKWRGMSIHNFFLAKSLQLTRPGGLVIAITSSFTLDAYDASARETLSCDADLVAAVRLPRTAFKDIAGTTVTTDILIFQKRAENAPSKDDRVWLGKPSHIAKEQATEDAGRYWMDSLLVNPYFVAHPEQAIGQFSMESNGYGKAPAVVFDGDLAAELAKRVEALPENIMPERNTGEVEVAPRKLLVASAEFVKPGAYTLADGKVAVSVNGETLEVIEDTITVAKARRIRAILPVRDAARKLLAAQVSSDDDSLLERYRLSLAAAYDAFTKAFGPISTRFNQSAYREDPDFPLLLSLEHWDEETKVATKADVFYRRTVGAYRRVQRCETPEEALQVCLAEYARVVPIRIAELVEMEASAVMDVLRSKGLVFMDPETMKDVPADEYLSGDVKDKLEVAEDADPAQFAGNVAALKEVIPEDIPPIEIGIKLGSTWVPAKDYTAFVNEELFGGAGSVKVERNAAANTWKVSGYAPYVAESQTWGTGRVSATSLVESALHLQTVTVTDKDPNDPEGKKRIVNTEETVAAREKLQAIKDAFLSWVWSDEARATRLARIYNDTYNRTVNRVFDGAHMTLPGFSSAYVLRPHQRNAVWRCVVSPSSTLLAHVVGAGKTLTMICAAMEMRRTGRASKPVLVVPNHMLEQFAAEFLRAYPAANILVASKDDMTPQRRKLLLARMATGDWDAVVMTHASFEKVPAPQEFTDRAIAEALWQIEVVSKQSKGCRDTRAVKALAKKKKNLAVRLERKSEGAGKDDLLDFAQIGFDWLAVDEAHLFKNRFRVTGLQMPGLPTSDSNRAFDMSVKVAYVQDKRKSNVVFATGTPIANSVAEMWVMQSYLQPDVLANFGLDMFDAWAANFGEPVTAMELAPDGSSYRMHTRFARFVNVPELLTVFRQCADIQTADMLDLPVPKVIRETVTAKASPKLKAYVETLVERSEKIRNGEVRSDVDNMLSVTGDGRKAATDFRLVGGDAYEGMKLSLVVENVLRFWTASKLDRGTQLVFLDQGTPGGNAWCNLYGMIREDLVARGVPAEEVAFIHDAKTDKAKEALFEKVRQGQVRVLIGSTSKMGTGMNVQHKLVALHHVDGPWRPADVEQREGRIIRQGNTNAVVHILRYVTEGTFDAYIWQTLETKARFIAQVMRGDSGVRSMEDAELAALTYAEVKALASGNPLVIEKAGVDSEVMRLSMLKANWQKQAAANRAALASLPGRIGRGEQMLADMREDEQAALKAEADLSFAIGGKPVKEDEFAMRVMGAAYMLRENRDVVIGTVGEFEVSIEGSALMSREPILMLSRKRVYEAGGVNKTPKGIVGQIRRALTVWFAEGVESAERRLERDRSQLAALRQMVTVPFEHEQRLSELLARQGQLNAILCAPVDDIGTDDVAQAA